VTEPKADAAGAVRGNGEAGGGREASRASFAVPVVAIAVAVVAVVVTWLRLFVGMDPQDESFYLLVPWRWALGDRPFVDEQSLAQMPGLLEYPFVKLFAIVRDYDVTGLVIYARHLYLLLMIAVALAAFLLLRRCVRWELAILICAVIVTFLFWDTPQLSYNTMGAAFLTLGAMLACWTVLLGRSPRWCIASGVAFGLAVVAYPTLLFIMPFYGVALAFALGRQATAMVASGRFLNPPDPDGPPTGRAARRALTAWTGGGALVLLPVAAYLLGVGVKNLERCWRFTMDEAARLDQLGGASKAVEVARGFWRFFTSQPLLILATLIVYLVYRRWPRVGRLLLAGLPFALWIAGQRWLLESAGFVLVYSFLAPYLYLFVPQERKEIGAKLLIWVWAPSLLAGIMAAYTSAEGYVHAPVGLLPALLPSGLFLAWALESVSLPWTRVNDAPVDGATSAGRPRSPWAAVLVLTAIVAVTIGLQFEYQQRNVPYAELTKRFDFGPWWGIRVTPERYDRLRRFDRDLRTVARPGDKLLVFFQACGYYLLWDGEIAANTYWLSNVNVMGSLPQSTFAYYRRHHEVPTVAVHLVDTEGYSREELRTASGGLDYPAVLVDPRYVLHRKPAGESIQDVLDRLPRQARRP